MHKSWQRTAIKTATENFGGFSLGRTGLFALELQQHDGRLVAVCIYNHLIHWMLRIAQSLVQLRSIVAL